MLRQTAHLNLPLWLLGKHNVGICKWRKTEFETVQIIEYNTSWTPRLDSPAASFQQAITDLQRSHAKIRYPDVILLIQEKILRF